MNNDLLWDDLRVVLAISETGSLSGAGRRLGLSHATVFRRIGDIETRLGARLFERARTGYSATASGEEITATARRIETEVYAVQRRIAGRDLRPSGTVRVTTTDTLLVGLLSPIFAAFRIAYPDIKLEVAVSNDMFNLSKREADLAIRSSKAPPETLFGRKIAVITFAVYGQRLMLGKEKGDRELRGFEWIGPDERMAYTDLERWMAQQSLNDHCRYRVDTVVGMLAAARDGFGLAALPCYLGDDDDKLARFCNSIPELETSLWLLTHYELRKTIRIRAFSGFVSDAVAMQGDRLSGKAGGNSIA